MAVQASKAVLSEMRNRHLFSGENKGSTPIVFLGPGNYVDQVQQNQSQPQAPNQQIQYIQQFGGCNPGQSALFAADLHGSENDSSWNLLGPRNKRIREQELLENSQISSIDFLQAHRNSQIAPPSGNGVVSTGLRLSLDDERLNSPSNAMMANSRMLAHLYEELTAKSQRQSAEIDQFLRIQGEQFRQALDEKTQKHQMNILACIEEGVVRKLQEKDLEVENIKKKNLELEERMKQLSLEAHAWQHQAKCNETMVNILKFNLQQAYAQSRETKEGCGDSEVDDAASCFNGNIADLHAFVYKENRELKEQSTCRVCRSNDVCILLLPCRHLCLCKDCESRLDVCPLCRSLKSASVQVYM